MGIGGGSVVVTALSSCGGLELLRAIPLVVEGSSVIGWEAGEQRCGKSRLERCYHVDGGAIEQRHHSGQQSSFYFLGYG